MPESLEDMLLRHEGFRSHVYKCPAGYNTIGIGRNVERGSGPGITEDEARYLLGNDIARVRSLLAKIPVYQNLVNPLVENGIERGRVRQMALENMCFQLGYNGLMDFKRMWQALGRGDWQAAHDECLDSKYAREDSPGRANEIAQMLLTGEQKR